MEIVNYAYQKDFLQIGYFLAVIVTIIKFYSEYFKGRPAYIMVLVYDLVKLTFVSLTVLIGFSVLIVVHQNAEAIRKIQIPEPTVTHDDRVSQVIEEFSKIDAFSMERVEAEKAFSEIYDRIFPFEPGHTMTGAEFFMGSYNVICGLGRPLCTFGEKG